MFARLARGRVLELLFEEVDRILYRKSNFSNPNFSGTTSPGPGPGLPGNDQERNAKYYSVNFQLLIIGAYGVTSLQTWCGCIMVKNIVKRIIHFICKFSH